MGKVKLGDIAVLINGDRGKNYPSQKEIITSGGIPFVNAGHMGLLLHHLLLLDRI